jgi:hypothetical protein
MGFIGPDPVPPLGLFSLLILCWGLLVQTLSPPWASSPYLSCGWGLLLWTTHTPIWAPSSHLSCGLGLLVRTTYPHMGPFFSLILWLGFLGLDYHMGPFLSLILWLAFIGLDHIPPYRPLPLTYLVAGVYWSGPHTPILAPSSNLSCGWGWGLLARTTYPHTGPFLSLILWVEFIGSDHIAPYGPLPLTYLVAGVYWSGPQTPILAPSSHLSCGWGLLVQTT